METSYDLAGLFQTVSERLAQQRDALNQADAANQDHGDHMVAVFQAAARAAAEKGSDLAGSMDYAAELLQRMPDNGSAQVYARGLSQLAEQFRQRQISLNELMAYVRSVLSKKGTPETAPEAGGAHRSGELLKALLAGLAGWERAEAAQSGGPSDEAGKGLDMGYLFGMGMSYLQAKQKGGDRLDILVETVVSASPLSSVPYRGESGRIALKALLQAMEG
jgi:hypothetical protein